MKAFLVLLSMVLLWPAQAWCETAAQYAHLGNVSGRNGNYAQAAKYYTKAIQADPKLANAYYNRGYAYVQLRKYKKAIADCSRAMELKPEYAQAYHVRGIAYFDRNMFTKAAADYARAIALKPDDIKFYYSQMSVNFKLGLNDRVWKDVIKIQQMGGTINPRIINLIKGKRYQD